MNRAMQNTENRKSSGRQRDLSCDVVRGINLKRLFEYVVQSIQRSIPCSFIKNRAEET